jgi:putative endonuclease
MTQRQQLGKRGEDIARRHLEGLGYSIIALNYRIGRSEIDLIARDDGTLVFVEVRTRRGSGLGTPEESVTQAKQSRMIAAAEKYLQQSESPGTLDWRIDMVAVELDARGFLVRVEVVKNAIEQ